MPSTATIGPAKRLELKNRLKERIEEGVYAYGERLPSGHQLAADFGTSYVTMNKALKLLVEEGYLLCRHGVGNFVNYRPIARTGRRLVNLIVPRVSYEGRFDFVLRFVDDGAELFRRAGWEVRIFLNDNDDIAGARSVIADPDAYSVIFGLKPYWRNFASCIEHIRNRVVLFGERSDTAGIACITSDETQTIRLALDHLASQGRIRTALVCADLASHLEIFRAAAWRSLCLERGLGFDWCRNFCFDMQIAPLAPTENYTRKLVGELYRDGKLNRFDSIIIPDDTLAAEFIGMLLDHGIRVPEDIAVVSVGNTNMSRLFRPQITSVDVNFQGHLEIALDLLEGRLANYPDPGLFHLCQPRLEARASSLVEQKAAAYA